MGLYAAMSTLRAVRRLRPDPIPDDVLRRVLEAATWAPTGGNRQPWRIIVVKDPVRKKSDRVVRAGTYLATHFHEIPVIAIFCFDPTQLAITDAKLDRVSVVGGGSIYPAVENL